MEIVRRVDDAFLAGLERGDFAGLSSETWRVKLMKPRPPRPGGFELLASAQVRGHRGAVELTPGVARIPVKASRSESPGQTRVQWSSPCRPGSLGAMDNVTLASRHGSTSVTSRRISGAGDGEAVGGGGV